jgi:TonB family protein
MKNFRHQVFWFAVLAGITIVCAAAAQQSGKPQPSGRGGSEGRNPSALEFPQNCRQFNGHTICRVGGEVSAPRLIFPEQRDHQPPTLFANSSNITCPCTAVLWVVVGRDGLVHYPRIIRSVDRELDRRAIEWVQKWKFEPARKSNKPVAVETNLEVKFR